MDEIIQKTIDRAVTMGGSMMQLLVSQVIRSAMDGGPCDAKLKVILEQIKELRV